MEAVHSGATFRLEGPHGYCGFKFLFQEIFRTDCFCRLLCFLLQMSDSWRCPASTTTRRLPHVLRLRYSVTFPSYLVSAACFSDRCSHNTTELKAGTLSTTNGYASVSPPLFRIHGSNTQVRKSYAHLTHTAREEFAVIYSLPYSFLSWG